MIHNTTKRRLSGLTSKTLGTLVPCIYHDTNDCTSCLRPTCTVEATISEVTSDKRIKAGEPILLRCKAAGYPRPEIHWTHLPTGKVVMSKTVNITSAELKDGGEYQCTAQNKHGRTTAKSMVTVSGETQSG